MQKSVEVKTEKSFFVLRRENYVSIYINIVYQYPRHIYDGFVRNYHFPFPPVKTITIACYNYKRKAAPIAILGIPIL